jgi:serine/threonine-protein kinase
MKAETRDAEATHPLIGSTLRGSYLIERLIDRGGMGLVFEATHIRLKRRVAVKMLPHHLVKDHYALARFRAEAEIIALLQHPHIVHVVDFDATEQHQPYIVMELLEGESLAARLEREARLPLAFALKVAVQTASALSAVHRAGIVHRDLKPANMFLQRMPGEPTWVKLLDFGISQRRSSARGLTGEHDVMGTPDYMSPEQALGQAASADHRSDQYSLAVIVYEMLAGCVPFSGSSQTEILSRVVSERAPRLQLLAPSLPARVVAAVERAMSKLPAERFETMEAFASALAAAGGVSLPPPPTGETLRLTSDPMVLSPDSKRPAPHRTNSGLRERTPSRKAPTIRGLSPRHELNGLLGRCERAYASRNIERAAELAEQALDAAERLKNVDVQATLAQMKDLLGEVLEARIGQLSRKLVLSKRERSSPGSLSPEEAFLLANVEQAFTVEELVDSSPLPRLQTLRLIARLLRAGWLS